jgi:hypothetical protein
MLWRAKSHQGKTRWLMSPQTAVTGTAEVPQGGLEPDAIGLAPQLWSVVGAVIVGIVLMFMARFVLQSPFFQGQRESAPREG